MSVLFRLLSFCLCIGFVHNAQAELFDLFNQDRGKEPIKKAAPPTKPIKKLPKSKPPKKISPKSKALKPQQDFLLKGISYMGKKYQVILKLPNGKERLVTWKLKQKRPIPQFNAYKLIDVKPDERKVKIAYPDTAPCRKSNQAKGVKCENKQIAELSFVYGKPSVVPIAPVHKINKNNPKIQKKDTKNNLINRFEKQVIGDDDVPKGMRRVRTPFGDRLVPIKP